MSNLEAPKLDLRSLLAIIRRGHSDSQPGNGLAQERLEALKAWHAALSERGEQARRLERANGTGPAAPVEDAPAGSSTASVPPAADERLHAELKAISPLDPQILARAREVAQVGGTLPEFPYYGPVKRFLARIVARAVLYFAGIITAHQRIVNTALLDQASESTERLNRMLHSTRHLPEQTTRIGSEIRQLNARVAAVESSLQQRAVEQDLRLADSQCDLAWLRIAEVEARLDTRELKRRIERIEALGANPGITHTSGDQQGANEPTLPERADRVAPSEPPRSSMHVPRELENMYVRLEDQFRGPRQLIKERFEPYLADVSAHRVGTGEKPILDLGCGRGEWLELLSESQYIGRGVDVNSAMVSQCRALGLEVVESDALRFLRDHPPEKLGMITAFHLLEHLPFERMVAVLDEVLRCLQPGGVAIFESPNPENITVSSALFHCDPTHQNLLHPQILEFAMRQRGFIDPQVKRLEHARPGHRLDELGEDHPLAEALNPIVALLNTHFAAALDFAVIGRKPG